MFTVIFTKEKNQIKSRSNLGDSHGNICTLFDFTYMHGRSKKEEQSEREKEGCWWNQAPACAAIIRRW